MSDVTQARVHALLNYDPLSGVLTWKPRPREFFATKRGHAVWNARYAGAEAGFICSRDRYRLISIDDKIYRAHRIIWLHVHGILPDQVDHEDGARHNNRLKNLRDVDDAENKKNMSIPVHNTSGAMGVIWRANRKRWQAQISVGNKCKYLGNFATKEEAVARRKEAERLYGFHANHGRAA